MPKGKWQKFAALKIGSALRPHVKYATCMPHASDFDSSFAAVYELGPQKVKVL